MLYEKLEKEVFALDKDRYFQVGAQLHPVERQELLCFLKENVDVFLWNAYEALGTDPDFICHHLNVNPAAKPKKQPHRHSSREHAKAVKEAMNKLKRAGAIKEAFYPEWLANTVAVKKKSRKWRVCVDFTNLNKVCPKDHFPIPQID